MVRDSLLLLGQNLKCSQEQVYSLDREAEKNEQVKARKITHLRLPSARCTQEFTSRNGEYKSKFINNILNEEKMEQ